MTTHCDGFCALNFPRGQPSDIHRKYRQSLDPDSYKAVFSALRRLRSFPCSMLDRMVLPILVEEEEAKFYVQPVQLAMRENGVISYLFFSFDEYECSLSLLGYGELTAVDVFGSFVRGMDSGWVYKVDPEEPRMIKLVESKFAVQIKDLYRMATYPL